MNKVYGTADVHWICSKCNATNIAIDAYVETTDANYCPRPTVKDWCAKCAEQHYIEL